MSGAKCKSSFSILLFGVPQGYALGPSFFVLYLLSFHLGLGSNQHIYITTPLTFFLLDGTVASLLPQPGQPPRNRLISIKK